MSKLRFAVFAALGGFLVLAGQGLAQSSDTSAVPAALERRALSLDSRLTVYAEYAPSADRPSRVMVALASAEMPKREAGWRRHYWPYFTIGGAVIGLVTGACTHGGCEHDVVRIGPSLPVIEGTAIGAAAGALAGLIVDAITSSGP